MGGQIDDVARHEGSPQVGRQIQPREERAWKEGRRGRRGRETGRRVRVGLQAHLLIPEGAASMVPPCVGTDAQGGMWEGGEAQMLLRWLCSAQSFGEGGTSLGRTRSQ